MKEIRKSGTSNRATEQGTCSLEIKEGMSNRAREATKSPAAGEEMINPVTGNEKARTKKNKIPGIRK
jgi:hypothetical protein